MKTFRKITSLVLAMLFMAVCLTSCEISYIDGVKSGSPNDYPDMTWGDQLDAVCSGSEWTEFETEDGRYIVEYNGTIDASGSEICIQYEIFAEDDSFEICYMDIDGEECDLYEISEVVDILFAE